jgi:pimeloyl-ACP methyl ester carboxylesterase
MFFARIARALIALALIGFVAIPARSAQLPPAPTPSETFDVGSLHVQRYGSGTKTLVLIPGLTCGTWEWYGTIAHFAPNYTIYSLTLPGFDGRPSAAPPLFDRFAADFWTLLDQRKIDKPIVIGHSLGGTLSFLVGEQHADRLRGIVAVDGLPIFPMVAQLSDTARASAASNAASSAASSTPAQTLAYEKNFMHTIGIIDAQLGDQAAALAATADAKMEAQWLEEDLNHDLRSNLAKIAVPLIEIMPYNAPDRTQPPLNYTQAQTEQFYASLIAGAPQARVVAIAPSRHFAMLDQPDKFYAIVEGFIASLK